MKAFLLTAGFGTRLRPISFFYPKPILPVLNRPIIYYLFDYLRRYKICEVIVNLHYMKDYIVKCIEKYPHLNSFKIFYSVEHPEILLTAGAIKKCEMLLKDEPFFLINGKIITNISLRHLLNYHLKKGNIATIVVKPNRENYPFTDVIFTKDRRLIGFGESEKRKRFFFTGVQILSPEVFKYIPENKPLHTTTFLYPLLVKEGKRVGVIVDESSYWYEFSTPERYFKNSFEIFEMHDMMNFFGENVNVGERVSIRKSIVGDNVLIANDVEIERSIIFGNNFFGDRTRISNSIILDGIELSGLKFDKKILTPLPFLQILSKEPGIFKKGEEIIYGKYLSAPIDI